MPPERTPRAMKPITTSPSIAIRIQSDVLTRLRLRLGAAGTCSSRGARAASSGSSRATSATSARRRRAPCRSPAPHPRELARSPASRRVALPRRASPALLERPRCAESAQSATRSSRGAASPSGGVGDARVVDAHDRVVRRLDARSRPLRMNRRSVALRRSRDCGSSLPAAVCALGSRTSLTMSSSSPRQTPTAPQTLCAHSPARTVSPLSSRPPIAAPTMSTRRSRRRRRGSRRAARARHRLTSRLRQLVDEADEQPPEALDRGDAHALVGRVRELDLRAEREHVERRRPCRR